MPPSLQKVRFTSDMLRSEMVQGFDCGDEVWEREVSDWLKAEPGAGGAVDDMANIETLVWLYLLPDALVGVGSIGPAQISWPKTSSKRIAGTCIPMLGVDRRHQGQGYGRAILDDLIDQARAYAAERPALSLYVHTENPAVDFYKAHGFIEHGKPFIDRQTGHENRRMVLSLVQPPQQQ